MKLIDRHRTSTSIEHVEKHDSYLNDDDLQGRGMHIIFIKGVEAEIMMLLGDGYA